MCVFSFYFGQIPCLFCKGVHVAQVFLDYVLQYSKVLNGYEPLFLSLKS